VSAARLAGAVELASAVWAGLAWGVLLALLLWALL